MTAVAEVRAAIHAALPGGDVITADRAHAYPQWGEYPTPCAWVGLPTVRSGRGSTSLTIPVALVVDGSVHRQVATLDDETARLWDALRQVKVGTSRAEVISATPESFGPEGATQRGPVFTVQVDLYVQTLCTPTLTA